MSVTIRDVAKAAEVSTATVSNVLNKTGKVGRETRRLVLSTVKKLGYIRDVHARNLASRDRRTLGIIVSDIENPFFPEVIKSFETRAQELGYDAILSGANSQSELVGIVEDHPLVSIMIFADQSSLAGPT